MRLALRELVMCWLLPAVFACSGTAARAQTATERHTMHATGTFEVKITPADVTEPGNAGGVGRMSIDKTWTGGIAGISKGEMLTGITAETGAMAYVAVERVTATVNGKAGSFILTHKATVMKTDPASGVMDITVVPNSGTGTLSGLTGDLKIDISGGVHHYDFSYELP